jgi:hypothetical protein
MIFLINFSISDTDVILVFTTLAERDVHRHSIYIQVNIQGAAKLMTDLYQIIPTYLAT